MRMRVSVRYVSRGRGKGKGRILLLTAMPDMCPGGTPAAGLAEA